MRSLNKSYDLTVIHLRVTIVKILTGSSWTVPCTKRLLQLLQLYLDVVDVRVDGDEVNIFVLLWSGLGVITPNLSLVSQRGRGRVALE